MALDVAPVPERQPVRAKAATLHLLNCFELRRCEGVVKLQPSPQRLLAFLAVHNRPLHRSFVAGNLWPDFTQDHANAALRTALWRLRGPTCRVVTATTSHLGLTGDLAVDLWEATERAQRAVDHRAERGEAVELCQTGDLLPDWYEDWLVIERERFRQLRLHALDAVCADLAAAGHYAAATEAGLAAIAAEPLRESAHRALISVHLAEGNVWEARRQYETYRCLLWRDLGLEPSDEIRRLVSAAGRPSDAPVRSG
jgi:DNA-binding SARP family transcriptional activator